MTDSKRVYIEEHGEEQRHVEEDRVDVLQAVAAEKYMLVVPNVDQERKADGEGENPCMAAMSSV